MLEGIKFGHKNAVDSAMESKPFVPQMNDNSQQNDSVKKNVDNNELAGNITIEYRMLHSMHQKKFIEIKRT